MQFLSDEHLYDTAVGCPVCLENYPEEGEESVKDSDSPWFQSFISEYPDIGDNQIAEISCFIEQLPHLEKVRLSNQREEKEPDEPVKVSYKPAWKK